MRRRSTYSVLRPRTLASRLARQRPQFQHDEVDCDAIWITAPIGVRLKVQVPEGTSILLERPGAYNQNLCVPGRPFVRHGSVAYSGVLGFGTVGGSPIAMRQSNFEKYGLAWKLSRGATPVRPSVRSSWTSRVPEVLNSL